MTNKEMTISISGDYLKYNYCIKRELIKQLQQVAKIISYNKYNRIYYIIAYDSLYEGIVKKLASNALSDIYLTIFKKKFMTNNIPLYNFSAFNRKLLLQTLIVFDSEYERSKIDTIYIDNSFTIEGYYYFRMEKIKSRWREICHLTNDNLPLLFDEDIFDELLHFLLSSTKSKVKTLALYRENSGYRLINEGGNYHINRFDTSLEGLLLDSIRLAPEQLKLDTDLPDNKIMRKFRALFCVI